MADDFLEDVFFETAFLALAFVSFARRVTVLAVFFAAFDTVAFFDVVCFLGADVLEDVPVLEDTFFEVVDDLEAVVFDDDYDDDRIQVATL